MLDGTSEKHDQWLANKGTSTMAHLVRADILFHYALADAFHRMKRMAGAG
jgi:phospholipase C